MVAGGMYGSRGACMVAGVCMTVGGVHGCRGHAWLQGGGMHSCRGGCVLAGACMVVGGHAWWWGACMGYDEIRSMSGRYASYWNAFLLLFEATNVASNN